MNDSQVVLANDILSKINSQIKKQLDAIRKKIDIKNGDEGFYNFCYYLFPEFFDPKHEMRVNLCKILHKCARYSILKEVEYKEYKKIMICVFPRFGKSFIISLWCVWCLLMKTDGCIMRNACTSSLAEKFSRDIRNFIQFSKDEIDEFDESISSKINELFPKIKLSSDKKSLEMWALSSAKDLSYICTGVLGSPTGFGCDIAMILDDPVKDPKQASSQKYLDDLAEWYLSAHRTRRDLSSNYCEIIIMARWSEDDLIGKLTSTEKDWKVFEFSAENEDGTSSCETIISTETIKEIRESYMKLGLLRLYKSLYLQKTEDMGQKVFYKNKMRFITKLEMEALDGYVEKIRIDYANEGTDYFASPKYIKIGQTIYIKDVIFTDKPSSQFEGLLINQIISANNLTDVTFESNNGGLEFAEVIRRELVLLNKKNITINDKRTLGNKHTRILAMSGTIINNFVFIREEDVPQGCDYYLFLQNVFAYKKEGGNSHDDAPDVLAQIAQDEISFAEIGVYFPKR